MMLRALVPYALSCGLLSLAGCETQGVSSSEPAKGAPAPNAPASNLAAEPIPEGDTPGAGSSAASAGESGAAALSASALALSASATAASPDLATLPLMLDEAGKPLPQSEDRPSVDSPAFQERMKLLFSAIQKNDPEIAAPVFFPKSAYEQVKDIEKPAADHKHRLLKAFARDIKKYHKKLGEDPEAAKLLGVEVDDKRVAWMKPGKEGNKLGYFRVTRSKIRYQDGEGQERSFGLTSLISWRGEWFVVHLDGFK